MRFRDLVEEQIQAFGTQAALARALGVSQQTVSNWRGGKGPDSSAAARFASVAGLDAEVVMRSLWPDDDPPSPTSPAGASARRTIADLERQLEEQRELLAELGRHLAEQSEPAALDAWSDGLLRAAYGGDMSRIRPRGPRTKTRPVTSSFDPDET